MRRAAPSWSVRRASQLQIPTERKIEAIREISQDTLVERMPFDLSIWLNAASWLA